MAMFEIYKATQGKRTRWTTFAVGTGLGVLMAYWLSEVLAGTPIVLQYVLPLVVAAGAAAVMFLVINRQRTADFLIATEGEMKKVSWSSRREIVGSTKVVIFTTFALAILLFVVDFLFSRFFVKIGVILES